MRDKTNDIAEAQQYTAMTLLQALQDTTSTDELTQLHLEDITELSKEVSRILPAGNVIKLVVAHLASIKNRQVSESDTRNMMNLLHKGLATFLDRAAYLTFYTGPALLIGGYQMLLRAVGKDILESFPNGAWQFYLEFGLREDTARHACETIGFQQDLQREAIKLTEADELAAWIMALSWLMKRYNALLSQEWTERVLLRQLAEKIGDERSTMRWLARRPYGVLPDEDCDYVTYRRDVFAGFLRELLAEKMRQTAADRTVRDWYRDDKTLFAEARLAYEEQMTILASLRPEEFSDIREPLRLEDAYIAVFYRGNYFMVPIVHNLQLLDMDTVRALAASILGTRSRRQKVSDLDNLLVRVSRSAQTMVRDMLPENVQSELERLRQAPVVLNWDLASSRLTLGEIRRGGRRGIGDHALTLFRTDNSMVFDQSHIFFDATWGMAVAEIVTNQATNYARAMRDAEPIVYPSIRPSKIDLSVPREISNNIRKYSMRQVEVNTEAVAPLIDDMNQLRRYLRKRNEDLHLTINDLLILYRSIYNQYYVPDKRLLDTLQMLARAGNQRQVEAAAEALRMLAGIRQTTPAFLIPIDASKINPRDRLFPVTFLPQPPWTDIRSQHEKTFDLLRDCLNSNGRTAKQFWGDFTEERTYYLEMLRMFGALMERYKEVALSGESFSTSTLRILAIAPKRLQPMLRNIPDRIDILNDMLKGTEVFSNVGQVAKTSSLTRFITAKDDNDKKTLCWGVMTQANGQMVITLRDFRPAVVGLVEADLADAAELITQDFLDGYIDGLTTYVQQLMRVVRIRSYK